MPLTPEDYITVNDHIARYCWAVDSGDGHSWAELWTPDGAFRLKGRPPVVGTAALTEFAITVVREAKGTMFHRAANIYGDYGDTRDEVKLHLYNMVFDLACDRGVNPRLLAKSHFVLVRNGEGWLIRSNDSELFAANAVERAPPA